MDFIYPTSVSKIILTKNFEGTIQPAIIKVAHKNDTVELFWYLNEDYLGSTKTFHEMPVIAKTGEYFITVVDENGYEIKRKIFIESE